MSFQFRPARREGIPLLVGLAGASGSGKTYSALSLASGIASVSGGKIAFIDTENRRGLHYADRFEFLHAEIEPPFTPARYGEAIAAAEAAGAAVVVVDSFSHEYEGEGGILDWANRLESGVPKVENPRTYGSGWKDDWKIAPVKPPSQWTVPKTAHKKLVNDMLRAKAHIIVCLRAEEKMKLLKKPKLNADGSPRMFNGKPVTETEVIAAADRPLEERWQPICEKRFPYEITTSLLLLPGNPGVPIPLKLEEQHKGAFPSDRPITAESGRFLAAWAKGDALPAAGNDQTQQKQTAEQWTEAYLSDVQDCSSLDDLIALQSRSAKSIAKLEKERPELYGRAIGANKARAAELQAMAA